MIVKVWRTLQLLNKSYGETIVLHILKYLVIGYNIMIQSFKIGMGEPIYKPLRTLSW